MLHSGQFADESEFNKPVRSYPQLGQTGLGLVSLIWIDDFDIVSSVEWAVGGVGFGEDGFDFEDDVEDEAEDEGEEDEGDRDDEREDGEEDHGEEEEQAFE